jgi:alkanesulfonate monooxygenase SsuD/methylene tetrahydromethanopterin reductase-like flavin-dependent oxidoreductase (luciferase family)
VIGGHAPAAFAARRAQRNGWYGWDLDVEQTAAALADLRGAESRYGRPAELEITITPQGLVEVDTARRYADLGVRRLVRQPHTMAGSAMDEPITTVGATLVGRV